MCPICERGFRQKSALNTHMRTHPSQMENSCPHCNKVFATDLELREHMMDHPGEMPYVCAQCGKGFLYAKHFKAHMRSHARKTSKGLADTQGDMACHVCPHCGAGFNTVENLSAHILTHDGEVPQEFQIVSESPAEVVSYPGLVVSTQEVNTQEMVVSSQEFVVSSQGLDVSAQELEVAAQDLEADTSDVVVHYKCTDCNTIFSGQQEFLSHSCVPMVDQLAQTLRTITEQQTQRKNHVCHQCGKVFSRPSRLKIHVEAHKGKKPYACTVCGKDFFYMSHLSAHMVIHPGEKPHKCTVCDETFALLSQLKRHMRTHTGKKQKVRPYCDDTFSSTPNLKQHMYSKGFLYTKHFKAHLKSHARKTSKGPANTQGDMACHVCPYCGAGFNTVENLSAHILTHNGEVPQEFQIVSESPAEVVSYPGLVVSTQEVNTQEFEVSAQGLEVAAQELEVSAQDLEADTSDVVVHYKCTDCNTIFSGQQEFTSHSCVPMVDQLTQTLRTITEQQTQRKIHVCHQCGKVFSRPARLKIHVEAHKGKKPYACTVCGKGFSYKSHLSAHMITHPGEKPHKCTVCGKGFSYKSHLSAHMITHPGEKPHKCTVCGKDFSYKSHLSAHMVTHTGERPYKCTVCDKTFVLLSPLKRHMRTHTGKKQKVCPYCDDTFSSTPNLKQHMYSHTKKWPHVCSVCNKSFICAENLNNHRKSHMRTNTGQKQKVCPYCDDTFSTASNLKRHLYRHTKKWPHVCSVCNKSFICAKHLTNHRKSHAGQSSQIPVEEEGSAAPSHGCSNCSKQFNSADGLNAHVCDKIGDQTNTPSVSSIGPVLSKQKIPNSAQNNDNKYVCSDCDNVFQSAHEMAVHICLRPGEVRHYCLVCDKHFKTAKELKTHDYTHYGNKLHECQLCGHRFSRPSLLKIHMNTHKAHTEAYEKHMRSHSWKMEISCPYCSKTCTSPANMQQHICSHTGEWPHVCSVCGKRFALTKHLYKHMRSHSQGDSIKLEVLAESPESSYVSPKYSKAFDTAGELDYHMNPLGDKPHVCLERGKAFGDSAELQPHLDSHALEKQQHVSSRFQTFPRKPATSPICLICKIRFRTMRELDAHSYIHTGSKPFVCQQCGKGFTRQSSLKMHLNSHKGRLPHVCPHCGKGFAQPNHMRAHIRSHTGEKPYKCKLCESGFAQRLALKRHMLTHTGERAHECKYCGKKFSTKQNLIVHINTHTGQFPHGCPHCEKRFPGMKQLRKHMQSHKKEQSLINAVYNDISGRSDPPSQEDESADQTDLDYSPEGVKDELNYEPPPLEGSSAVMNNRYQIELQDHSYFSVSCMGSRSSKPVSSMGEKSQTTTERTEMPSDMMEVHDDPSIYDIDQEENAGFSHSNEKTSSVTNTSASKHGKTYERAFLEHDEKPVHKPHIGEIEPAKGNPPKNEVIKETVAKPVLVPKSHPPKTEVIKEAVAKPILFPKGHPPKNQVIKEAVAKPLLFPKGHPTKNQVIKEAVAKPLLFPKGHPPKNEVIKEAVAKPVLVPLRLKGSKNSDTGEKPYVCSYCQRGFMKEASLKLHIESHEGICLHCGIVFKKLHHYTDYMRIHLGIRQDKCIECTKEVERPAQLNRHSSSHEKQRLQNENQQHQPKKKTTPGAKMSNLLNLFETRNPKTFTVSSEILKQAVKSGDIHLGDNPVKEVDQTECKSDEGGNIKTFSLMFHLQNQKHDSITDDSCLKNQGVSTVLKTKDAFMLKDNRPDTEGENHHECPYCSKTFQSASLLKEHIDEHMGAIPHKCPECGKGYATLSGLRKHCTLHSAEKAVTECNVETTNQGHLETNINTITKEAAISDSQGSLEQTASLRSTEQFGDHVYSATPAISAVHEVKSISAVHEVKALNSDLKPNSYKVKEISDKVSRRMNRQLREQVHSESSVSKPALQIGKIVVISRIARKTPQQKTPGKTQTP